MATKGKSARKRHSRRNVKKKEENNHKPEEVVVNIESNLNVERKPKQQNACINKTRVSHKKA